MLAEYDSAEALLAAARAVRRAGYARTDAFTPFPVDTLPESLGWRRSRIAS